jgi:1A family penicillin-binding protein
MPAQPLEPLAPARRDGSFSIGFPLCIHWSRCLVPGKLCAPIRRSEVSIRTQIIRPSTGARRSSVDSVLLGITLIPLVVLTAAGLVALTLFPIFGGAGQAVMKFQSKFGSQGPVEIKSFPERTTVYAADGSILATLADYNRRVVKLGEVNDITRKAILAIEDDRFYERNAGIDIHAIARAAFANLKAGKIVEGGSTITQQIIKNTLTGGEQTFSRKFQEAQAAIKLESQYTKDEILEKYLNLVYFGHGTYGIASASEYYFGKGPQGLTLSEAAVLAGVIKAPAQDDPIINPERALERRNQVLSRMLQLGWINSQEYVDALSTPIELSTKRRKINTPGPEPYFVRYVEDTILHDRRYFSIFGKTYDERRTALFQGGLKIYTTIDPRMQRLAKEAVDGQLPNPGRTPPKDPESAVVSILPQTGRIQAMYAGQDFSKFKFNLATQAQRTAGSAFKLFTLVAALENGIPPGKVYDASVTEIPDAICRGPDGNWKPSNAEPGEGGFVDLRSATTHSINVVFAQLIRDVGPEKVVDVARRMGITGYVPPVCSITLGAVGVSPLDMTSAYSVIANGGVRCEPIAISKVVTASGRVLVRDKPKCKRVISAKIAATVTSMLESVVSSGTGTAANIGRPQAGKTGTGQEYRDAWFMGFIRQLCTGVWVGYSKAEISMNAVRGNLGYGIRVFGGTFPARIWHDYMIKAVRGLPVEDFPAPPAVATGTVPNVVGKSLEQARNILSDADFTSVIQEVPSLKPAGEVVGQDPGAGATLELGTAVIVQVSNGKIPIAVVPNVIGLTQDLAVKRLFKAGFSVTIVHVQVASPAQDGIVLTQDPVAGTKAKQGTIVRIVVGAFGANPSPTGKGKP